MAEMIEIRWGIIIFGPNLMIPTEFRSFRPFSVIFGIFQDFASNFGLSDRPKYAKTRLLEAQGTGKSIKNGSGLFMVFSSTIAQHNGIVADPES